MLDVTAVCTQYASEINVQFIKNVDHHENSTKVVCEEQILKAAMI